MDDKLISNISYTAKDFQQIYPELLDLVTKLSNKWDPSLSNESDPGVLLLKLNALIADKNNYNIDKNVLECFPTSVTQEGNAGKLYDSLGYRMHWYQSATSTITLQLKSTDNLGSEPFVKIPVLLQMAQYYHIDEYISSTFFLLSPSQNYAVINYLLDSGIPLVINNKLSSLIGKKGAVLSKKFGIDLKELMKKYPYEEKNTKGARKWWILMK